MRTIVVALSALLVCAASSRAQEPVEPPEALDQSDILEGLLAVLPGFEQIDDQKLQDEVADVGGISFRSRVALEYLDRPQAVRYLQEVFDSEYPPARAAADARTLLAFDLLPAGADLRALRSQLLSENVVGFYDERPGHKRLYAVSRTRGLSPLNQIVLAHELRHALQDQYADLHAALPEDIGDFDDRRLAFMCLLEGDATLVMERFLAKRVPALGGEGLDLASLAVPEAALPGVPPVLRDQLVLPYLEGLQLAKTVKDRAGWGGLREAWNHPPTSTEQVLHPEKYESHEPPLAVEIGFDPGRSARSLSDGVLGEMLIRTLLNGSAAAAAGWGGDHYRLWDISGKTLLVWRSLWDTPEDRREFVDALRERFAVSHGSARDDLGWSLYQRGAWTVAIGLQYKSAVLVASDDRPTLESALRALR